VLIALITSIAYAQNVQTIMPSWATEVRESSEQIDRPVRGGDEEPIWFSDFSTDGEWTPETTLGDFEWVVGSTETGWFYANGINSNSGGNYAFFYNGDPNGADPLVQGDADLTTTNAINVAGIESALLEFEVYGARFTDSLKVQVSNNGTDFVTVGNHQDVAQLTNTAGDILPNSTPRTYNITLNVAEQDELWIRFNAQSATSGITYGWFIDDVTLTNPEPFDLAVGAVYTGDIINDYEYTMTPIQQAHPIVLGGDITNFGGEEAINARMAFDVFLEGDTDPVYSGETAGVSVLQGATEQVWLETGFTPSDIGDYTVEYEVLQDSPDGFPVDNTAEKDFRIDEIYWANDDYNNLDVAWSGELGNVAATDEWMVATTFTVFEEGTMFEAVQLGIGSATTFDDNDEQEIAINLFFIDFDNNGQITFLDNITDYTLTDDEVSPFGTSFVDIEIEDQVELQVGISYVVAVQHNFSSDLVLEIDCSEADPDFSTFISGDYNGDGGAVGATWFTFDDLSPAIRLATSDINSVEEIELKDLTVGQSFPNPSSDIVTVPFNFEASTTADFEITDMAGRVVYRRNLGTVSAGAQSLVLDDLDVNPGIYTYTFITANGSVSKTMTRN